MERIVLSNKGIVKAQTGSVLDLIHDASTFRPSFQNAEKADLKHRGYAILTGIEPTAGIVRLINKKDKTIEDYLVIYPFTKLKPNVNLFGLGRAKVEDEQNLDEAIEYTERIKLQGEELEDLTIGASISNKQLKKAYKQLLEEKEIYPELYEKVISVLGGEEINPDADVLRLVFQNYAKENPKNIKDLKALGLQIKSPEDLSVDMDFGTVKLFLESLLKGNKIGKAEIDDKYEVRFIPTNLIETGVLYEQESKEIYEIISFFPERIKFESGRAVAQRLNSKDSLYPTRMILLNILNRNILDRLKNGDEELYAKVEEKLEKLQSNENIPEKGKKLISKVLEWYKAKDFDILEKALKKMWIENKKVFEDVMLSTPIVNVDNLLKQTPKGTFFLSNPLSNRGYSLNFTKKIFDASRKRRTLDEDQDQLLLGIYINLPRVLVQEGKIKVERVYKPYAIVETIYDKTDKEIIETVIYKSKPEYIFDKWDRRIAGAINKKNIQVLEQLKKEIVETEKSLSTFYPKLIDEAINQIQTKGEFSGVVKEYVEEVDKAKNELYRIRSLLKNRENLIEVVQKFVNAKTIIEIVPFNEIPPEKELVKEMKNAYWHSIGLIKEIRKSLYYTVEKLQEPQSAKEQIKEDVDLDIELDGFETIMKEDKIEGKIAEYFEEAIKTEEEEGEEEENLDFLFDDEEEENLKNQNKNQNQRKFKM